jgi:hypothetical protein
MNITIGKFDDASKTVPVVFKAGAIVHRRQVNAVITDGGYDKAATAARVREVAAGVGHKIEIGVIS